MQLLYSAYATTALVLLGTLLTGKWLVRSTGTTFGWYLRRKTAARRQAILSQVRIEERDYQSEEKKSDDGDWEKLESHAVGSAPNGGQADDEWEGMIGFFHPFCNAGGGGERVLWAAIRATQQRWPKAICIIYTGDHEASKAAMLERVENHFNIHLHPPTVVFLYLQTRHYVIDSAYPHFTLLGQSLGSLVVAHDAFSMLVPDIFIDTMGYAFTLALSKFLFPEVPTGAYVHYPTISTDMLGSLDAESGKGLNAGAGKGWKGKLKRVYWQAFAWLYGWVGGEIDVVMTNSSWTQAHINSLWSAYRAKRQTPWPIEVVYPPVAVEELQQAIPLTEEKREPIILCIAQFRPEKNHALVIRSFAKFIHLAATTTTAQELQKPRLVLIGSVRNSEDATKVYDLRLLAHELKIKDQVEFICDASWPAILEWLRLSSVGINGMWNEHFGIGVVEYQAAGLLCVVNDSGGPFLDIVIDHEGGPTGFHANSISSYSTQLLHAISLSDDETLSMRRRARSSAKRFREEAFAKRWVIQVERLVAAATSFSSSPSSS